MSQVVNTTNLVELTTAQKDYRDSLAELTSLLATLGKNPDEQKALEDLQNITLEYKNKYGTNPQAMDALVKLEAKKEGAIQELKFKKKRARFTNIVTTPVTLGAGIAAVATLNPLFLVASPLANRIGSHTINQIRDMVIREKSKGRDPNLKNYIATILKVGVTGLGTTTGIQNFAKEVIKKADAASPKMTKLTELKTINPDIKTTFKQRAAARIDSIRRIPGAFLTTAGETARNTTGNFLEGFSNIGGSFERWKGIANSLSRGKTMEDLMKNMGIKGNGLVKWVMSRLSDAGKHIKESDKKPSNNSAVTKAAPA